LDRPRQIGGWTSQHQGERILRLGNDVLHRHCRRGQAWPLRKADPKATRADRFHRRAIVLHRLISPWPTPRTGRGRQPLPEVALPPATGLAVAGSGLLVAPLAARVAVAGTRVPFAGPAVQAVGRGAHTAG
jgi:hypothetical protein